MFNSLNQRQKQNGNIFAVLFGAVALAGALAAVSMQTISGPIQSATKVTYRNMIESDLLTNTKMVEMNALELTNSGDIDDDSFVEPPEYIPDGSGSCSITFTGGGCLPDSIGANMKDAYNTPYAYCVWDHGSVDNGHADGAEASPYRLNGNTDNTSTVVAIISAGPDRTFQTSCTAYDGAGIDGVVPSSGSDDIVFAHNYMQSVASIGGLWSLKETDNTVAETDKNLEIQDETGAVTATIASATGFAEFLGLTTDVINSSQADNILDVNGYLNFTQSNTPNDNLGYITINQIANNGSEIGIRIRIDGDPDTATHGVIGGYEDAAILVETDQYGVPADATTKFAVWGDGELYIDKWLSVGLEKNSLENPVHIHDTTSAAVMMEPTSDSGLNIFEIYSNFADEGEGLDTANPTGNNRGWRWISHGISHSRAGALTLQYFNGSSWISGQHFTPDGKMGIGTASPTTELDVNGNVIAQSPHLVLSHDGATDANNDYISYTDHNGELIGGNAGFMVLRGDTSRGKMSWTDPNNGFAVHSLYARQGVGVGTTSPSEELEVNGTIRTTNVIVTSDSRFKEAIRPLKEDTKGLETVKALKPVRYEWKDKDTYDDDEQIGFIAQDIEKILPELISGTEDRKAVDYIQIIPILVQAIQEQNDMIDDRQARIETLKQLLENNGGANDE